ncbi:MAG: aldehyde dehydrogenase family protein [Gammaproteobacteria bacterium]|nr:aldehyde dehydrogenase family protein [Gammaproteobacteria bacterium]
MSQLNFINNQWVASTSGLTIEVIDPATAEVYDSLQRSHTADVDAAVQSAQNSFAQGWGALSAQARSRLLMKLSQAIDQHQVELAAIEQRDCGKPSKQATADALALVRYFEFYAGCCDKLHGDTLPYLPGYSAFTWREPHGVTGHIIPWNYPLQIFGRSVAASLAAGNTCVIKPSEDACLSILRVAQLSVEVGFPAGTLNIITGYGHEVGSALAQHPGIDHLSFTGSPRVGTLIQQLAAERHCPVTLELGGKSPQIVFADADQEAAVPFIINAIVQNAGQTCSAGSRLLVEKSIYPEFLAKLAAVFSQLQAGPPNLDLALGPLIRASQITRVQQFMDEARHLPIVAQGSIHPKADARGFYQAPILYGDVPVNHRLAQEEVFGPILSAMPFESEEHAIQLANSTHFGLVAGIWTENGARQWRVAKKMRCGQVFINNYGAGGGIELPFGGVKSSGYGREKGFEALLGFTTLKTVAVKHN